MEKKSDSLLLDVGTEAIKAILYHKKEERIVLLGSAVEYFDNGVQDYFFQHFAFPQFLRGGGAGKKRREQKNLAENAFRKTIQQTMRALDVFQREGGREFYVSLSPPFFHTCAATIIFERKNPDAHISQKEEKEILESGMKRGKEDMQKLVQELYGIFPQEYHFVKLFPLSFSIDGYPVAFLRNLTGRRVVWSAVGVVARKELVFSDVFHFFRSIANDLNMKFASSHILFPAECFAGVSELLEDGIFIDIGGRVTQVFVVQRKALEFTFDFPVGAHQSVEALGEDLGISEVAARELLERYSKGLLTQETATRVKNLLRPFFSRWRDAFWEGFRKGGERALSSFFIFGGGGAIPDIKEILKNVEGDNFAGISPCVSPLTPSALSYVEYGNKSALTVQYTPALLFTSYASTEKKNF